MVISRCYFNSYNAFFPHIIPILRFLPLIPDLRKAGYLALCLQFSAKKNKTLEFYLPASLHLANVWQGLKVG